MVRSEIFEKFPGLKDVLDFFKGGAETWLKENANIEVKELTDEVLKKMPTAEIFPYREDEREVYNLYYVVKGEKVYEVPYTTTVHPNEELEFDDGMGWSIEKAVKIDKLKNYDYIVEVKFEGRLTNPKTRESEFKGSIAIYTKE